jgi:hypothetical protein
MWCAADWMTCMTYDLSSVMQGTELGMAIVCYLLLGVKTPYVFVSITGLCV